MGDDLGAEPDGIHGFASEDALDAYLGSIEAAQPKPSTGGCGTADAGAAAPSAAAGDARSNETITNNQEAGVDEGGIVKNIGQHLVVLRKGRLYVVDVADGKAPTLVDSMAVARSSALNGNVWYDEMLVKGDLVYVVGYRYGVAAPGERVRGATEIDSFRLVGGRLSRLKSMFLESNDYYSGRNYASRMVAGKLVFYMPHYVGREGKKIEFPRVLEAGDDGAFRVVGPIFGALDVTTSLRKPLYPTFHTVVQCALPESGDLACHGRSVLGSYWRETYVAPGAVYLWASRHVYRFDFASLDVRAHAADGYPIDQFAFREVEGKLLVAVNRPGGAALLEASLAAFDGRGTSSATAHPLGRGGLMKNRFVGDVLVAALAEPAAGGSFVTELVAHDAANGASSRVPLPRWVQRIEPLGERRALVVTSQGAYGGQGALELRAVSVDAVGRPLGTLTLDGVQEGEGRSHGFFYKPGADGAGTFGYAVVEPPRYGASSGFGNGISNIGFFDVAPNGRLGALGVVSSGADASVCETSCVDWYGNTRPIFLRDRVFALMGSELAEVTIDRSARTARAAGPGAILAPRR